MGEERRNELLDSPLYDFVKRGWGKWSREIVSVQVTDEDFLLYLVCWIQSRNRRTVLMLTCGLSYIVSFAPVLSRANSTPIRMIWTLWQILCALRQ